MSEDAVNGGLAGNTVQIRVEHTAQLFNMLDPYPFRERDLDPDAEEYIVERARELPSGAPLRIIVLVPGSEVAAAQASELPDAVKHFFAYRAGAVGHELKELFRVGRIVLAIGLAVLGVCLVVAQGITGRLGHSTFADFVEEGLIIVGWVALWRPLEIFLYDWWPLLRRRTLYRRIAAAEVTVQADPAKP